MRIWRLTGGAVLLAVLAWAAWHAVQLARADWDFGAGDPESVVRATELAPGTLEYDLFAALQAEYDGQDPVSRLERIAAEHPRASEPRIRLGLALEAAGDVDAAEQWLLQAAEVDHQFEPAWTLANFYFRRDGAGNSNNSNNDFWRWMRTALAMSYGDRTPAFDLCWRMSQDPAEILYKAFGTGTPALVAYVYYLLDRGNVEATGDAALLLSELPPDDPYERGRNDAIDNATYAAMDRLLADDAPERAAELWLAMGQPTPDGVLYPRFHVPGQPEYLGRGFDWRYLSPEGVSHADLVDSTGEGFHRIELTGDEPESGLLLLQIVGGLEPGAEYRLAWDARLRGIVAPSGLTWEMGGVSAEIGGEDANSAEFDTTMPREANGEMRFTATAPFEVLSLNYQRPLGQPRAIGDTEIVEVSIAPL